MKTYALATVAVVFLLASGALIYALTTGRESRDRVPDPGPPSHAELRAIKQELAEMRTRLHAQGRRDDAATSSLVAAASAVEAPPPPAPTPEEAERRAARVAQSAAELVVFLRAEVDAEPRDTRWSREAVEAIRGTLATPDFAGSSVDDVDCRSTLCRLEVSHQDDTARETFAGTFPMKRPELENGTLLKTESPDGKVRTIAFFARQGHSLPNLAD